MASVDSMAWRMPPNFRLFIVEWRQEVQNCDHYESSKGDGMVFPAWFLLLKDNDPKEASARLSPGFI